MPSKKKTPSEKSAIDAVLEKAMRDVRSSFSSSPSASIGTLADLYTRQSSREKNIIEKCWQIRGVKKKR